MTFDAHPEGTLMTVQGQARRSVRRALTALSG
jgi:hypothetical protein